MTMHAVLTAEKRDGRGKGDARKLRATGRVPGVVYGQGGDAITVMVDAHDALRLFQRITVENTIVDLSFEGESIPTLVREIQVHPIRPEILHIDFYRVQKGVKISVEIPVHLNGTPVGVKSHGGVLQQVIHELPVSTIPSLIPDSIEVDVTGLDVGDSIHVGDLEIPDEVEVELEPDRTVCSVIIPRGLAADDEDEDEDEDAEPELIGEDGEVVEAGEGEEGDESDEDES